MKTDQLIKMASDYQIICENFVKEAFIRKLPNGKYRVLSEKGKNMGTFDSKLKAKKRLSQIEFFKHDKNHVEDIIDLSDLEELSFSAFMRKLRKQANPEQVKLFLQLFKKHFDNALKEKLQKPEKIALQESIIKFNKKHKIKIDKELIKNAAVSELGTPEQVGKYLSNIVKFTINRIKPESRHKAMNSLRKKFYYLNEEELSNKKLPASSSMGQSITFVKHVLFNHDPRFIRQVLNSLVRNLQ